MEQLAVAHERVRVGVGSSGAGKRTRSGSSVRTITWSASSVPALRQRNGSGSPGSASAPQAAHATVEAGRRAVREADDDVLGVVHHASRAPVRSLNASINESQTGIRSSRERQKVCERRASKSAIETPCCSTHVK